MAGIFDELRKWAVWDRGKRAPGHDEKIWRIDEFGMFMRFSDYGDRNSAYGWEIDHIVPKSRGGSDDWSNLRPLHYRNNAALGGLLGALTNL